MIRTLPLLAAFALVSATSALAETAAKPDTRAFTAELSHAATAQALRKVFAHRGYITTSEFKLGADGLWHASAMKDGKPVSVAMKMPPRIPAEALTN